MQHDIMNRSGVRRIIEYVIEQQEGHHVDNYAVGSCTIPASETQGQEDVPGNMQKSVINDWKAMAFDRAWQQHRQRVWNLLVRFVGDRDCADDLCQEPGSRAHRHITILLLLF